MVSWFVRDNVINASFSPGAVPVGETQSGPVTDLMTDAQGISCFTTDVFSGGLSLYPGD